MRHLLGAAFTSVLLTASVQAVENDSIESILKSIPVRFPELSLAQLDHRSGEFHAHYRDSPLPRDAAKNGTEPPRGVAVLVVKAATEKAASDEAERLVHHTPVGGSKLDRNGLSLHVWRGGNDPAIYRVTTRIGTTVVDVSTSHPLTTKFVVPILDAIVQRLRE